jgi:hypothetical protein
MRTLSTQASAWLPELRVGQPLPGVRRQEQAEIDLRAAELIEPGSKALSEFGAAVLNRWEQCQIPEGFDYELPRAVALLEEALEHRVRSYIERLAFWWDICQIYNPDDLLADAEALLLLPYLNQTRAGFNPWAVLFGARQPIHGPIDWQAIKATLADPSKDTDRAIDVLADRAQQWRSVKPRVVFCRAMELIFVSRFRREDVRPLLEGLVLPQRSER